MAKSDLLKEAIADAKAVKETALANAKIALQEAFQPRIKSMLETELMSELEEDEMDMDMGDEMADDMADDMGDEMGDEMDDAGLNVTIDDPATPESPDYEGEIAPAVADDMADDMDEPMDEPMDDMGAEDDLDLEEIIRELEEDLDEGMYEDEETDEGMHEGMHEDEETDEGMHEMYSADKRGTDYIGDRPDNFRVNESSIDELIEAILAEEEDEEKKDEEMKEDKHNPKAAPSTDSKGNDLMSEPKEMKKYETELKEAYDTVAHLKSVINEVNLLNAKLLYTNKLFRNFDLNEDQKMKVIENFDRAGNTREAKLVFSTLAESFHKPTAGKKIVKESKSLASKPVATTAPSKETTQVLTEGFEQANRWKKLAGLIK